MYRLAHLSLSDLSTVALASLPFQLTPTNVLFELFDSVSGVHDEIQKMELAHAVKHCNEVKATPAMKGKEAKVKLGELG